MKELQRFTTRKGEILEVGKPALFHSSAVDPMYQNIRCTIQKITQDNQFDPCVSAVVTDGTRVGHQSADGIYTVYDYYHKFTIARLRRGR